MIFLFVLIWIKYFVETFWLSMLISAILTLVIDFILKAISSRKNKKNQLINQNKNKIENYINYFVETDKKDNINFFFNLAKTKHNTTKNSNYICICHPNKKIILFPYFFEREIEIDDIIYIANKCKKESADKIIVLAKNININAINYANKSKNNILILGKEQVYSYLLEKYNYYPEIPTEKEIKKTSFKQIINFSINKKRTKGYFLSSVILVFSSFFVPYKLYYIIMASLLLALSFVCFYSNNIISNQKQNPFDELD